MAGRSHVNWGLFLTLLKMGVSQADAAPLVGVKPATPYVRASRLPAFAAQVSAALEDGRASQAVSPIYFSLDGELILDASFDAIPRHPHSALKGWVLAQLRRNPLAMLAN